MENNLRQPPILPVSSFEVFAEGLDHPEGLAFDDEGVLWAGGELGQIYRIDASGGVVEVARLGGFCLGLTFSARQELWVCNSGLHALMKVDRRGHLLEAVCQAGGRPLKTPNFSVFDQEGFLYFSDSGEWNREDGFVYCRRPDGAVVEIAGGLAFPNGLALDATGSYLYVVLSQRDQVIRIPVALGRSAGEPELYAAGLARVPDGVAFDGMGNLYVTCYASDCIYRVAPDRTVQLLASDPEGTLLARPTNVAFGGPRMEEVYVANLGRWHIARATMTIAGQPLANLSASGSLG